MKVYEVMEFLDWLEKLMFLNKNYYVKDCIYDLMITLTRGKAVFEE